MRLPHLPQAAFSRLQLLDFVAVTLMSNTLIYPGLVDTGLLELSAILSYCGSIS